MLFISYIRVDIVSHGVKRCLIIKANHSAKYSNLCSSCCFVGDLSVVCPAESIKQSYNVRTLRVRKATWHVVAVDRQ